MGVSLNGDTPKTSYRYNLYKCRLSSSKRIIYMELIFLINGKRWKIDILGTHLI